MKIRKNAPHNKFSGTIPDYISNKLKLDVFEMIDSNPGFCVRDAVLHIDRTSNAAFGRLVDVLAEKGLITAQDVQYIAEDFCGEPHQIKFIKG